MSARPAVRLAMVLALSLTACSTGSEPAVDLPSGPATLTVTSPAFSDGGTIPTRFTCDGPGISPPLRWAESKPAEEFVLVVTDPDA
ncbi:MAG: YbhB/YbcL family Raf kinase inhibitor-like protein, partial [Actinomycetota bacterium]